MLAAEREQATCVLFRMNKGNRQKGKALQVVALGLSWDVFGRRDAAPDGLVCNEQYVVQDQPRKCAGRCHVQL